MTRKISVLMTGYYAKALYDEAQRVLENGEEPLNPIVRIVLHNKLGDIAEPCAAPKLLVVRLAPFVRAIDAYNLLFRVRGVERVIIENQGQSWTNDSGEPVPDYPAQGTRAACGKKPGVV